MVIKSCASATDLIQTTLLPKLSHQLVTHISQKLDLWKTRFKRQIHLRPLPPHKPLEVVQHFDGPLLFTAPHGISTIRNGQLHKKEVFTTDIVLRLSEIKLENKKSCSYIIWDKNVVEPNPLDPNYTAYTNLHKSDWFQGLKNYSKHLQEERGMHYDIHGCRYRFNNIDVYIGMKPMQHNFENGEEISAKIGSLLVSKLKQLCNINAETNCELFTAYASEEYWTMSQQSTVLGIPAVQLELTKRLRKTLKSDDVLLTKFYSALYEVYESVFV